MLPSEPTRRAGWEVFNHHPPYIPDLAPSDFHLLLHLKEFMFGQRQRFQNEREPEMGATEVLIPGGSLLRHRIQKLVPRYDKCLICGDEYVKKYPNTCCICSNKPFHKIWFCFCKQPQGNLLCGRATYSKSHCYLTITPAYLRLAYPPALPDREVVA